MLKALGLIPRDFCTAIEKLNRIKRQHIEWVKIIASYFIQQGINIQNK
jgi:hypothetical protein